MDEACGRCGKVPAAGYAAIGDTRYCHGDGVLLTCYERAGWLTDADARTSLLQHLGLDERLAADPARAAEHVLSLAELQALLAVPSET